MMWRMSNNPDWGMLEGRGGKNWRDKAQRRKETELRQDPAPNETQVREVEPAVQPCPFPRQMLAQEADLPIPHLSPTDLKK